MFRRIQEQVQENTVEQVQENTGVGSEEYRSRFGRIKG